MAGTNVRGETARAAANVSLRDLLLNVLNGDHGKVAKCIPYVLSVVESGSCLAGAVQDSAVFRQWMVVVVELAESQILSVQILGYSLIAATLSVLDHSSFAGKQKHFADFLLRVIKNPSTPPRVLTAAASCVTALVSKGQAWPDLKQDFNTRHGTALVGRTFQRITAHASSSRTDPEHLSSQVFSDLCGCVRQSFVALRKSASAQLVKNTRVVCVSLLNDPEITPSMQEEVAALLASTYGLRNAVNMQKDLGELLTRGIRTAHWLMSRLVAGGEPGGAPALARTPLSNEGIFLEFMEELSATHIASETPLVASRLRSIFFLLSSAVGTVARSVPNPIAFTVPIGDLMSVIERVVTVNVLLHTPDTNTRPTQAQATMVGMWPVILDDGCKLLRALVSATHTAFIPHLGIASSSLLKAWGRLGGWIRPRPSLVVLETISHIIDVVGPAACPGMYAGSFVGDLLRVLQPGLFNAVRNLKRGGKGAPPSAKRTIRLGKKQTKYKVDLELKADVASAIGDGSGDLEEQEQAGDSNSGESGLPLPLVIAVTQVLATLLRESGSSCPPSLRPHIDSALVAAAQSTLRARSAFGDVSRARPEQSPLSIALSPAYRVALITAMEAAVALPPSSTLAAYARTHAASSLSDPCVEVRIAARSLQRVVALVCQARAASAAVPVPLSADLINSYSTPSAVADISGISIVNENEVSGESMAGKSKLLGGSSGSLLSGVVASSASSFAPLLTSSGALTQSTTPAQLSSSTDAPVVTATSAASTSSFAPLAGDLDDSDDEDVMIASDESDAEML